MGGGHSLSLSVRDLLSWAGFITSSLSATVASTNIGPSSPMIDENSSKKMVGNRSSVLKPWEAYVHGAALVLLDGMGLGSGLSPNSVARLRKACSLFLSKQVRFFSCSLSLQLLKRTVLIWSTSTVPHHSSSVKGMCA